jgi:suppressor of ftsI
MRRLLALVIALAWLAGCGGRASGPSAAMPPVGNSALPVQTSGSRELPEPPVVKATHGVAQVTLIVDENKATGQPEFVYDGMTEVAPTIEVNPGETIEVSLKNQLPTEPPPDAVMRGDAIMSDDVNLHFHGLGVSPMTPGDNVLGMIAKPGRTLHYVVPIPKNQEPGLYWYHPHVHGEVNYQVGDSGMSGAIVIDGLEKHLPGLAKMRQRLIVVRATGAGSDDPLSMRMHPQTSNTAPCTAKDGFTVSLNGVHHPDITMAPGEKQFFRIVNATGHKTLRLNVEGEKVEVVAIDGFALDTYPGTPPTLTEPYVIIPPAARAEFVVTGPASGHTQFRTMCYDTGPNGDPDPYIYLAHIVAPKHRQDGGDFSTRPLTVGSPLPPNVYDTALPAPSAKRLVVFSEDNRPHFFINGKSFSMRAPPMFVVHTGTVEEWKVVNVTQEIHDFHIHQIHFLVVSVNGVKVVHPHWADSFIIPHRTTTTPHEEHSVPGTVVMLMDFRDPIIRGEFVFHCHILDHEDQGMMAKIEAI